VILVDLNRSKDPAREVPVRFSRDDGVTIVFTFLDNPLSVLILVDRDRSNSIPEGISVSFSRDDGVVTSHPFVKLVNPLSVLILVDLDRSKPLRPEGIAAREVIAGGVVR